MLEIRIDSNGIPRIPFNEIRTALWEAGKTFDAETLKYVPYHQLSMCAIANAGRAACAVDLVLAEKRARRNRFLNLPADKLASCQRYLRIEGMLADVERDIEQACAPQWSKLTARQQVWCVFTCIANHVDNPAKRFDQVVELLRLSALNGEMPATEAVDRIKATNAIRRTHTMVIEYPPITNVRDLRDQLELQTEAVMEGMSAEERQVCLRGVLRGYSCTSDCFQTGAPHHV
jgi:hypothetical protein